MLGSRLQPWHDTESALGLFGHSIRSARKHYVQFMNAGVNNQVPINLSSGGLVRSSGSWETLANLRREHSHCIGDERILGDSDFVGAVLSEDSLALDQASLRLRQGWSLEKLITRVCMLCEIEEDSIRKKARANDVSKAKALLCYWGTAELGLTTMKIAARLQISQQAVSKWAEKGRNTVEDFNIGFPNFLD
jgi:hypothetical protein